jgi:purine-binding chemotaxis protein CheW
MSLFNENHAKGTEHRRYLEFILGNESYAVELLKVKEVITLPELTPIPKAPAHVCGLMNLRGLVLTVVDLRKKLGIPSHENQSQSAVIIFDLGERLVGAVVDSIQKVLNISLENTKPVPDEGNDKGVHLLGILQQDSKLTLWIDPSMLLDGVPKPNLKAA